MKNDYHRPNELAQRLGVSKSYIYMLIRLGEIPVVEKAGYKVIADKVAEELVQKWILKKNNGHGNEYDRRFKLMRKAS